MKLIHKTSLEKVNEIESQGLLSSKKSALNLLIDVCKNEFRPNNLPDLINLSKCVYFYPIEGALMSQVTTELYNIDFLKKYINVQVLSENLEPEKLYVTSRYKSDEIAQKNLNFLKENNLIYLLENNDLKKIKKVVKIDLYKQFLQKNKSCIEEFWNSITPFGEYEKKYNETPFYERFLLRNSVEYEILYFNDVPVDIIEIKTDVTVGDSKLQDLKLQLMSCCKQQINQKTI